jgi:hypothetical protein
MTEIPTIDPMQGYYYALGRFFHQFGRTEDLLNNIVHRLLVQQLHTQHLAALQTIQAVLGGMRVKMLSDAINRTLSASGAAYAMREDAKRVLDHLGEIHYIRDRLAHNAAYPGEGSKEGWFYTNNNITVREDEKANVIWFQVEALNNMTVDLAHVPDMLERILFPEETRIIDEELGDDPDHAERVAALQSPWRYRLSQLTRVRPRPRPIPQGRKRGPSRKKR